jgi:ribosomal protein S18 acetylase RimI-like enzyme
VGVSVDVRLVPMSATRYPSWVTETITGFAEQQVASGSFPEPEARAYAESAFHELLPEGLLTRGHHVWSAYDGDLEVGYLWLAVDPGNGDGYVYDVAVSQDRQGRGYGRALMLAGEKAALSLGAGGLRLTVFGHNRRARRLYDNLGYEATATMLGRRLDGTEPLAAPAGPAPRLERVPGNAADTWACYAGDTAIGTVGLAFVPRSDGLHAIGRALAAGDRQNGRAIMVATEDLCRRRGAVAIEVDVPGPDPDARSFYERLGFGVTATLLHKSLQQR